MGITLFLPLLFVELISANGMKPRETAHQLEIHCDRILSSTRLDQPRMNHPSLVDPNELIVGYLNHTIQSGEVFKMIADSPEKLDIFTGLIFSNEGVVKENLIIRHERRINLIPNTVYNLIRNVYRFSTNIEPWLVLKLKQSASQKVSDRVAETANLISFYGFQHGRQTRTIILTDEPTQKMENMYGRLNSIKFQLSQARYENQYGRGGHIFSSVIIVAQNRTIRIQPSGIEMILPQ